MVTADEVGRSLRGTVDLLNQRIDGLRAFDFSEASFWRSFQAICLTLPAYEVTLAFEHRRLAFAHPSAPPDDITLALVVGLGHVADYLALPLAMIVVARRLGLGHRYVPFAVVTNWVTALGTTVMALPAALLLIGWATPGLARLFTLGFAVILLRLQWFGTKATLGLDGLSSALVVVLGVGLDFVIACAMRVLIG
jgi:hypothetical protein